MIALISLSGHPQGQDLQIGRSRLIDLGFDAKAMPLDADKDWPFHSATTKDRALALTRAIEDPQISAIISARGGYGCSQLLSELDWNYLGEFGPKAILGFSDVCALLSGFFTKLRWPCVHAPMPMTKLWPCQHVDAATTRESLKMTLRREETKVSAKLTPINSAALRSPNFEGWLFGGCLSVLSNLIGTSFLPQEFAGAILIFEDVAENPGRIARNLTQWQQAGLLEGVKAIVIATFESMGEGADRQQLLQHLSLQLREVALFASDCFGHVTTNLPFQYGQSAHINGDQMIWHNNLRVPVSYPA